MSYISVEHLSKSFGQQAILHDVSFSIEQGSITGLLGPNGSGKTTMIRLLNGVIQGDEGVLRVRGLDPITQGDDIRKHVGIVTESTSLYEELNALENLRFFAKLYDVYDEQRVSELLAQFGLHDHQHKKVSTYSTGMKKRLALAKALLHQPDILFLDEPTNGLDPEGIQMVMDYLVQYNRQHKTTIVICTHVLQQIEHICDYFVFLHHGKVLEEGTKEQLEEKYLTNIQLKVETDLIPSDSHLFEGTTYEQIDERHLRFTLASKEEISPLLQRILIGNRVYECTVENRDLESLYFAIRGEKHE